jgi:hypothetical protein
VADVRRSWRGEAWLGSARAGSSPPRCPARIVPDGGTIRPFAPLRAAGRPGRVYRATIGYCRRTTRNAYNPSNLQTNAPRGIPTRPAGLPANCPTSRADPSGRPPPLKRRDARDAGAPSRVRSPRPGRLQDRHHSYRSLAAFRSRGRGDAALLARLLRYCPGMDGARPAPALQPRLRKPGRSRGAFSTGA